MNVSVNGNATFFCVASHTDLVRWFVNQTSVDNIPGLKDSQTHVKVNDTTHTLRFGISFRVQYSIEEFLNNTLFYCVGFTKRDDGSFVTTDPSQTALLMIQGSCKKKNTNVCIRDN